MPSMIDQPLPLGGTSAGSLGAPEVGRHFRGGFRGGFGRFHRPGRFGRGFGFRRGGYPWWGGWGWGFPYYQRPVAVPAFDEDDLDEYEARLDELEERERRLRHRRRGRGRSE